jgi:K+ transporter
MFVVGGTPALLITFIRYGVRESAVWRQREAAKGHPPMTEAFAKIFSPRYARRTVVNSLLLLVSIVGLWAGSVYVPTSVREIALREGHTAARATTLASYGTMVLSAGTIVGCLMIPAFADRLGRRLTLALYFAVMFFSISVGFGYVFFQPGALKIFFGILFLLGLGGANFGVYTIWLPEQYSTECRGSAFAFATSVGRLPARASRSLSAPACSTSARSAHRSRSRRLPFSSACCCCRSARKRAAKVCRPDRATSYE